ncbi:MAG: anaerobic sulfatase maturase [Anaerolineales bacterium]|nr:anaerobic sulfatase maturase [Anaerolineales bacterium]
MPKSPTWPPPAFQLLAKPSGAACNLDCRYCFFLAKEHLYPGSRFRMPPDVLEAYVREYLASQSAPEVIFVWQGGEPTLLGLDFYREALRLQARYRRPGVRVSNSFQTNGILLDDAWGAFLQENHFLVGLSLDGPRALHDAFRVDKGGAPTFDRVWRAVEVLKRYAVEFNILTTLNAANVEFPLEVYRFLRDEVGAPFIQFIPIVERVTPSQDGALVSPASVTAAQFGRFLINVFDEWARRDVGRVFVQAFDVALAKWLGLPGGLCVHEETCGAALVVEHTGDVYSCDHYVEPHYRLGNLTRTPLRQIVGAGKQKRFGDAKRANLPRCCRKCDVRFACHGGCPKERFIHTPEGEAGLNYLCAGYLEFFRHIDPAMRFMAEELRAGRPAANLMGRLAAGSLE